LQGLNISNYTLQHLHQIGNISIRLGTSPSDWKILRIKLRKQSIQKRKD